MTAERRVRAHQPSIADVAAHAGVAIGTVSNTLNRPDKVREATRRRVLAAIKELGFVRNDAARSLAAGSSNVIGLVLADVGNSFFVDIARGAESVMREHGMDVLMVNSDIDHDRERHNLELLERARVAGVLLTPFDTPQAKAHPVVSGSSPTVLINFASPDGSIPSVISDERLGGHLAAQHLIDLGRRRLLFMGGPLNLTAVASRRDGAISAAAASPDVTMNTLVTDGLTVADGRRAGEELRRSGPGHYDGVVAASDLLAIGLIQTLRDVPGFAIPADVAVTGYDDNHFAAESDVPITTVRQRGDAMGRRAGELLLDLITNPEAPIEDAVFEPELIPRRSTLGDSWHPR